MDSLFPSNNDQKEEGEKEQKASTLEPAQNEKDLKELSIQSIVTSLLILSKKDSHWRCVSKKNDVLFCF